jgi:hypothetical protein
LVSARSGLCWRLWITVLFIHRKVVQPVLRGGLHNSTGAILRGVPIEARKALFGERLLRQATFWDAATRVDAEGVSPPAGKPSDGSAQRRWLMDLLYGMARWLSETPGARHWARRWQRRVALWEAVVGGMRPSMLRRR